MVSYGTAAAGRLFSQSVSPDVDTSKKSKNGASEPKFTASSVLAAAQTYAYAHRSAVYRHIRIRVNRGVDIQGNWVGDAMPPNADESMSTCGMR